MSCDDWKEYKLGDLLTVLTDYHANGSYIRLKENVELLDKEDYALMIRTKNFEQDDFTDVKYISEHAYNFLSKSKVQPCDIIMNKIANAGSVYLMPNLNKPVSLGMNLFLLRVHEHLCNQAFVYYYLKSNEDYIKTFALGSVTTTITKQAVKDLKIKLPSRKTQDEVVAIISTIEKKIELNRQTAQTLEAITQALFKEWFVNFNFPGATGEMEESDLGMVPNGWRVVSFEDELNADRGLSYKGNGLAQSEGVPMHNLNSIYEGGGYKKDGIKYYTGEYKEKHVVEPGDLIIANTEQGHKYLLIGYPAIIPSSYGGKGIFSHHIYKFKPKPTSYLTSEFLFHLLLKTEIREQVVGFANGTTVNMLKIEGLQKPKFVLPPQDIVQRFTTIAFELRNKAEENILQNQTLTQLRDSLLPRLMKGEIKFLK